MLTAAAALAAAGCTGGSAGTTTRRAVAPPMRVGCFDAIDRTQRPFAGGYRRVLGAFAVPPARVPQVAENTDPAWPYWTGRRPR